MFVCVDALFNEIFCIEPVFCRKLLFVFDILGSFLAVKDSQNAVMSSGFRHLFLMSLLIAVFVRV